MVTEPAPSARISEATDFERKPGRTNYRVVLAIVLFITLLVSYLDRTNISVLIADADFLNDLDITGDTTRQGLLLTVFLLAYGVANIVLAPLGNVLGPRKAMMLSILVWAISVVIGGLAGTFGVMLAARILLGAGEGLHWPMQSLFVANWFPPKERGKANSAWLVGLMVGPMIAAPIITAIVVLSGWRASFYFLAVLSLVPLALLAFLTTDTPRESKRVGAEELHHIESGIAAANKRAHDAAGGAPRSFLTDWRFWGIALGFMCSSSVFWGTIGWLPSYLFNTRGFAFRELGFVAALPYILGAITVLVFGAVADRVRVSRGIFPTIALLGAATFIYLGATVSNNMTSAILLACSMGCIGIGLSSYWTMMQNIVTHDSIGPAAGVMNGVAQILSAFVPTIVGAMIAANDGSYTAGLMFLVGAGTIGGLIMLVLAIKRV